MAEDRSQAQRVLTVALWVYLIDNAVFGILVLALPRFLVETLGASSRFDYYWFRWAGGVLIALAIGCWLVLQRPEHQGVFVTVGAMASLFVGLGLALGWVVGEYHGAGWFIVLTLAASFPVAALLFYARQRASQLLS